jgi:hypothetical protein
MDKAKLIYLAAFLGLGGIISYNQINSKEGAHVAVVVEEVQVAAQEAEVQLMSHYYAAETYDGVLVPFVFVSEVITEKDIEQFKMLTDTVIPQMEYNEIEKGVDMLILHANKNREYPVYIEVIRVTE